MEKWKPKHPYGYVANTIINCKELSLGAKGVYLYILSKPEEWDFSVERIANDNLDSDHMVNKYVLELEEYGLLERLKRPSGRKIYAIKDPVIESVIYKSREANSHEACAGFVQVAPNGSISNKELKSNKEESKSFEKIQSINTNIGFPLPEGWDDESFLDDDSNKVIVIKDENGMRVKAVDLSAMKKTYERSKKSSVKSNSPSEFNFEPYVAIWNKYPDAKTIGVSPMNPSAKKCVLAQAKLTPDLKKLISQYAKKYEITMWQHAIEEYVKDILNRAEDPTGYYLHRMSMYDFLYQKNGFTKFVNK